MRVEAAEGAGVCQADGSFVLFGRRARPALTEALKLLVVKSARRLQRRNSDGNDRNHEAGRLLKRPIRAGEAAKPGGRPQQSFPAAHRPLGKSSEAFSFPSDSLREGFLSRGKEAFLFGFRGTPLALNSFFLQTCQVPVKYQISLWALHQPHQPNLFLKSNCNSSSNLKGSPVPHPTDSQNPALGTRPSFPVSH